MASVDLLVADIDPNFEAVVVHRGFVLGQVAVDCFLATAVVLVVVDIVHGIAHCFANLQYKFRIVE